MLWLKSKTQLTIIPNEAPVMNEIKEPKIRIRLKMKMINLGNWRKDHLTLRKYSSLHASLVEPVCRTW